jgi:dTDP-4-amino-4,6-dideoxygalactose transaminase
VGTLRISPAAVRYVNDVLASNRLSYGPYLRKFEGLFAAAHGCRFAVMTNSGTSSLTIALQALKAKHGWRDGDEVIVPAVTFVATANVVLQAGMKPVFVDVDPVYYELDPAKIEAAVGPRTRCIVPVHLFGCPCDMGPILRIAGERGLRVIEDSCEAMFVRYEGRPVGSFGDVACFSTYVAHILCTGVGGLCTTNAPDLAVSLRSLMNHGRDSIYLNIDDDDALSPEALRVVVRRRFSFVDLGYSFRITEMEGALGLAAYETREANLARRSANAARLARGLRGLEHRLQLPTVRPNAGHAFMMFPVVLRDATKTALVDYLEAHGIETRDMLPLVNQPVYRRLLGTREEDYPVAKWVNESGFYVGCHQDLSDPEIDYVAAKFQDFFAGRTVDARKSALVLLSGLRPPVDALRLQQVAEGFAAEHFDELVVADASGLPEVAATFERAGFRVLRGPRGKGDLLRMAVAATTADFLVVAGADGSDTPQDANRLVVSLRQGSDLVVASRFLPGGERQVKRFLSHRSLGNRLFALLVGLLYGARVTDPNGLYRAFSRQAFATMAPRARGDSVVFETTVGALSRGLRYAEVPVVESRTALPHRRYNRILLGATFLWHMARRLLRRRPPRP